MSKPLSTIELKKLCEPIFKDNPEVNELLAITDGNVFLPINKNAAELHVRGDKTLSIIPITRDGYEVKEEEQGEGKKETSERPTLKSTVPVIQDFMKKEEIDFVEGDTKQIMLDKIEAHYQAIEAEKAKA